LVVATGRRRRFSAAVIGRLANSAAALRVQATSTRPVTPRWVPDSSVGTATRMVFAAVPCARAPRAHSLYRPRFVGHRVEGYAARAAG
jgi:hypothetical protein